MSTFKLMFAGEIKKVEIRQAGAKPIAEVSLCNKNRAKQGDPDTFTWVRATIWSPPDWMTGKLVKGAFIAGCGDFSLRSFEKDGVKRQSAEINCQGFDVTVGGSSSDAAPADNYAPRPSVPSPSSSVGLDDEPPFSPGF